MVSRVALDTNYARQLLAAELEAIRERGLEIVLPLQVLQEMWAHAWRKRNRRLLDGPLQRLVRVVDARTPLLPMGDTFAHAAELASFQAGARRLWHEATMALTDAAFESRGKLCENEVNQFALESIARRAERERLVAVARAAHADFDRMPLPRAVRALRELFPAEPIDGEAERTDALHAVRALAAVQESRGRTPSTNDAEDFGLALCVAHPAFVLTEDRRFLRHVDDCGSFQAPWFRTLGELLTDHLPPCVPWGAAARRVGLDFRRQPHEARQRAERELRARLRATGGT